LVPKSPPKAFFIAPVMVVKTWVLLRIRPLPTKLEYVGIVKS